MTFIEFILVLLVGFFIGTWTIVAAALWLIARADARKNPLRKHTGLTTQELDDLARAELKKPGRNPFEAASDRVSEHNFN